MVEISRGVLNAAAAYFGLGAAERVSLHCADGLAFLAAAPDGAYDVVIVDAADPGVADDAPLEAPPAAFVAAPFLRDVLARVVAPSRGLVVLNVISTSRAVLRRLAADLRGAFDGAVYCLAMDPNYVFFAMRGAAPLELPPEAFLAHLHEAGLSDTAFPLVAGPIIGRTAAFLRKRVLLGWLRLDEMQALLEDEAVRI